MTQETATLTIYTHPDCAYSQAALADLQKDGIPFNQIDVTLVDGATEELERLTGGERITPVIIEGELVTVGYGGVG